LVSIGSHREQQERCFDLGLLGGFNTYAYVRGNPLSANDPSGNVANFLIGAGIGAIGSVGIQLFQNGGDWRAINVSEVVTAAAIGAILPGVFSVSTEPLAVAAGLGAKLAASIFGGSESPGPTTIGDWIGSPSTSGRDWRDSVSSILNFTSSSGPYPTGPGVIADMLRNRDGGGVCRRF
jgi:hypothetical protein